MNKLFFSTTATLLLCCGMSTAAYSESFNPQAEAYYQKFVEKYGGAEEFNEKRYELYTAAKGKLLVCQQDEERDCSYYQDLRFLAAPNVISIPVEG